MLYKMPVFDWMLHNRNQELLQSDLAALALTSISLITVATPLL